MHNKGLQCIKNNKKNNTLHLCILLVVLLIGAVAGTYLGGEERLFDPSSLQPNDESFTVTIGGIYNHSFFSRHQNMPINKGLTEIFAASDVNLFSLSTPFVRDTAFVDGKSMLTYAAIKTLLDQYNINLVQLSDQRILSLGVTGLLDTVSFLSMQDIQHVGAGLNKEEAIAPVYFSKRGKTIAVLAINAAPPPGWAAGQNNFGVAAYSDRHAEILAEVKDKCEVVITLVSFPNEITRQQKEALAMELINDGVHIVVGTGTGAVQKAEVYKNGIIFFNIGNLWSPQAIYSYERESVVLQIAISPDNTVKIKAIPLVSLRSAHQAVSGGFYHYKISQRLGGSFWQLEF